MATHQHSILGTNQDDARTPQTRTKILAIACAVVLTAVFIGYLPGLHYAAERTPTDLVMAAISFLICMVYSTELSSVPVASRHTAIPLLVTMMLITEGYNNLLSLLIIITLVCATLSARNVFIGSIRAATALMPIPIVAFALGDSPKLLHEIFISSIPRPEALHLIITNCLFPLVIATVLLPLVRFICDMVMFFISGVPIRKSLGEYSLTRIIVLSLADFAAIVVTVLLPAIYQYSNIKITESPVRSILTISLDVYALILMSFYTLRRMAREEASLRCLLRISDALPLPSAHTEHALSNIINQSLPNIRCIMMTDDQIAPRLFHSYRHSRRIKEQGSQYTIVFERSIFSRPFLPSDEEVLAAAASVLNEELRVNREVGMLRSESETDPLTGAYTYAAFIANLRSMQTESSSNNVAVIYLNIDQFKRVNDRYGRLVGNSVLRTTTARINELIPDGAFLARVSGNEFAVILNNFDKAEDVENLADRLRDSTSLPIQTEMGTVSITMVTSLSFATSEEGATQLLIDAGLHESDITTPLHHQNQSAEEHLAMSDALRDAIHQDRLSVMYQPIFRLDDRTIQAIEMFPRITDSHNHRLDFDFILSEAQRLDLGCELTLSMLDHGVKDLLEFRKITPTLNNLCLTLNGGELNDSRFYERLEMLNKNHPDITICLQFGEAVLNTAQVQFDDDLAGLTSMSNVRIALTQAGTTYSEVSALANLPLNVIKLDPSIVNGYGHPLAMKIIGRTVEYAKEDHVHLVFSGINTVKQTELLHHVHGNEAQGNVYASIMAAPELRMRLETMGLDLGTPEPEPQSAASADASPATDDRAGEKTGGNDITKPSYDL